MAGPAQAPAMAASSRPSGGDSLPRTSERRRQVCARARRPAALQRAASRAQRREALAPASGASKGARAANCSRLCSSSAAASGGRRKRLQKRRPSGRSLRPWMSSSPSLGGPVSASKPRWCMQAASSRRAAACSRPGSASRSGTSATRARASVPPRATDQEAATQQARASGWWEAETPWSCTVESLPQERRWLLSAQRKSGMSSPRPPSWCRGAKGRRRSQTSSPQPMPPEPERAESRGEPVEASCSGWSGLQRTQPTEVPALRQHTQASRLLWRESRTRTTWSCAAAAKSAGICGWNLPESTALRETLKYAGVGCEASRRW
mmetsp:Transcript_86803/g.281079  ORF Transcript_86803/g.281079 Transcript_86803/m.281079 type:complete len:322 (+) Transcript_86803:838-1803(+)